MFFAPRRVQSLRFFLNTVLSVLFICAANTAYAESREALEPNLFNSCAQPLPPTTTPAGPRLVFKRACRNMAMPCFL